MLIIWSIVFVVSLVLMVKGADWLVESSEKIGLVLKSLEEIVKDNPFLDIKATGIKHPDMPDIDSRLLEIRKPLDEENP